MNKNIDIGKEDGAFKISEDGTIIRADENNENPQKSKLGWIIGGVAVIVLVVIGILLLNWYNENNEAGIRSQIIKEQTAKVIELTGKNRAFWISYHITVAGESWDESFHLFEDCSTLQVYITNSGVGRSISYGRVEDALKDKGHTTTLCIQCEDRVDNKKENIADATTTQSQEKKETIKTETTNKPSIIKQEEEQNRNTDANIAVAELREHKVIVEEKPIEEKPFITVEQMPTFHGGEHEMQKFISDNLRYPVDAQEAGIQGRVTLRFVVSKTGTIENITVVRGIDASCDKEAVRVVQLMPKWIPGKQNGLNVPVYFNLSIQFRLQN